jgi:hypothetical protein
MAEATVVKQKNKPLCKKRGVLVKNANMGSSKRELPSCSSLLSGSELIPGE